VKIDLELLNNEIWLKVMVTVFLLTDYSLKCRVASNGKKIIYFGTKSIANKGK